MLKNYLLYKSNARLSAYLAKKEKPTVSILFILYFARKILANNNKGER